MGKRRNFTAETVPLVGGALVLDFLNTTGNRGTRPRERLHGYRDLLTWGKRAGLVNPDPAATFLEHARADGGAAASALGTALELREDLYAVLAPLAVDEAPSPTAVRRLERWFRQACGARSLDLEAGGLTWRWQSDPARLESVLWPILGSAEEVLAERERIKKCGECDWLFIDESRNASRRWCKKLCADRVRARRYYARKKGR